MACASVSFATPCAGRSTASPHRRSRSPGCACSTLGAVAGILSEAVARLGADVHGVDVVERNIAVASLHARQSGVPVRYETTTAEALAARGARYDVTVISTINRTALSYLFAILGAEYVLGWLPKGTHQWRRFPKPRELEALLARDGIEVVERRGVAVNPLTKRFRLTSWMAVNYMLVARKDTPAANAFVPDKRQKTVSERAFLSFSEKSYPTPISGERKEAVPETTS